MAKTASRSTWLVAHLRLAICGAVGAVVAFAWPGDVTALERILIGWNVLAWLYLAWSAWHLWNATGDEMKRLAVAQADSAPLVLGAVVGAAVVSVVAVVFELSAAKSSGSHAAGWHAAFALVTVAGSWLLLPVLFALAYASRYFEARPHGGLIFPGAERGFEPDHVDFLYFSITIAVASQTSDVAVSTRPMRRLVAYQSLLSFTFNAMIVALLINVGSQFV